MLVPLNERRDEFEDSQALSIVARDLLAQANTQDVQLQGGQTVGSQIVPGLDFSPSGSGGSGGFVQNLLSSAPAEQNAPAVSSSNPDLFPTLATPDASERPVEDPAVRRRNTTIGLAGFGVGLIGAALGNDFLQAAGSGVAEGSVNLENARRAQLAAGQQAFDENLQEIQKFNRSQLASRAAFDATMHREQVRATRQAALQRANNQQVRQRMLEIENIRRLADLEQEQLSNEAEIAEIEAKAANPSLGEKAAFLNAQTSAANARLNSLKRRDAENQASLQDRPTVKSIIELDGEMQILEDIALEAEPRDRLSALESLRQLREQRQVMVSNLQPGQLQELDRYNRLIDDAVQTGQPGPTLDPFNPNQIVMPGIERLQGEAMKELQGLTGEDLETMRQMVQNGEMPQAELDAVLSLIGQ